MAITIKAAVDKFAVLLEAEKKAVQVAQNQVTGQGAAWQWEKAASWWREAAGKANDIHLNWYNYANDHPNENDQKNLIDPALNITGMPLRAQPRALQYTTWAQDADANAIALSPKPPPSPKPPALGKPVARPPLKKPVISVDPTTGAVTEDDVVVGKNGNALPSAQTSSAQSLGIAALVIGAAYFLWKVLGRRLS